MLTPALPQVRHLSTRMALCAWRFAQSLSVVHGKLVAPPQASTWQTACQTSSQLCMTAFTAAGLALLQTHKPSLTTSADSWRSMRECLAFHPAKCVLEALLHSPATAWTKENCPQSKQHPTCSSKFATNTRTS